MTLDTYIVDHNGAVVSIPRDMLFPVRCHHCGDVYDIGAVKVTARYADCSVWTTPCCGVRGVDDRPWVARRHYTELRRAVLVASLHEGDASV